MATSADEPDHASEDEPRIGFAFQTAEGIFTDPADLPPEARAFLLEHLDTLPIPLRKLLAKTLGADSAAPDSTDTTRKTAAGHRPDCTCDQEHREMVWQILDAAFPASPHLWAAGEALFALSDANPTTADEATQRAALQSATRHLTRQAELAAAPPSPAEQIVLDFRKQMGGL